MNARISKRDPTDGKKFIEILAGENVGNSKIACGKCMGCRLDKAHDMANRCMVEAKEYKHNYFLTLTYDNDHLPIGSKNVATIDPNHFTKFMKDLRMYYKHHYDHDGIRFYGCGEYGDKSGRPHYHIIIFNLPIYDLTHWKNNFGGDPLLISDTMNKIWKKGYVVIGDVSFESAGYVARYTMKKQTKTKRTNYYEDNGIVEEFVRMSRMPGIGRAYYDRNRDKIYKDDGFYVLTDKGSRFVKPPAYYDRLYDEYNQPRLDLLKEQRKSHLDQRDKLIREDLGMDPKEYLQRQFEDKARKGLALKRNKTEM